MLANIRGGGEFGPAWHEAGLKTHRQLIYDDFAAVAQDLIARKITSPRRLGIEGGSNGGLLMGVEFTQHPELWNAVDIQVPLLDMLRYEQIAGRRVLGRRIRQRVQSRRSAPSWRRSRPTIISRPASSIPSRSSGRRPRTIASGPQHARKFAAQAGGDARTRISSTKSSRAATAPARTCRSAPTPARWR